MTYAHILNADDSIIKEVKHDNFDAAAVAHKFGADKAVRIVPVEKLANEVVADPIKQRLGPQVTTVEPTRVTKQQTVIALTSEERIDQIKQEANGRILNIASELKQRNLLAHSVEMERNYRLAETPTAEQLATAEAAEIIWTSIKAIRAHSNAMEASIGETVELTWDDLV
tara:strand:+ start:915 stop:1424 length:510 start_codon:yes stop_codon:yes gene_type:complete